MSEKVFAFRVVFVFSPNHQLGSIVMNVTIAQLQEKLRSIIPWNRCENKYVIGLLMETLTPNSYCVFSNHRTHIVSDENTELILCRMKSPNLFCSLFLVYL